MTDYGTQPYGLNISANLVCIIEQLYDKATSPVQMSENIGEWFRTTVRVKQGCLLSPTLFNIFLEQIMSDAMEEHNGKVSIGGRNITNLCFADDIDALAEEEQERTKLITNSANGIQRQTKVKEHSSTMEQLFQMMAPKQMFSQ